MSRKGKKGKRKRKLAEATCPGKEKEKKKKKKENWQRQWANARGYFRPLSSPVFSLQFSLYFGEKFFWWVRRENTRISLFIFLHFHPTKHIPKKFHSHFLFKIFHSSYFISKQTHHKFQYNWWVSINLIEKNILSLKKLIGVLIS